MVPALVKLYSKTRPLGQYISAAFLTNLQRAKYSLALVQRSQAMGQGTARVEKTELV